ncbi:hypothetical protein HU200_049541 [Digitaria exilis]|uniref:Uncharacterized protein n=1 Tax=Digitaria exilis TaxID=1010633 RepID=A0A835AVW7_9POAL|nr:hypothetical protein HU200_049541 [Digitaria exilis]
MASVEVRPVRKSTALRARNGPSKLQPARSMPVGYRYSAAANGSGGGPKANGGSRLAAAAEADDEEMEEEVVRLEGDDADSPYSSKAATVEEVEDVAEKGGDGEEVDSAATPRRLSPTAATSPSQGDARWGDTSSYGAKKKHRVFCQLPNGDWALCTILTTSGDESVLKVSEGKVLKLKTESLQPANPEILDGVDDLMQLSYLSEPSTKAGPVLVAVNPFKKVSLYGNEYIDAYRNKTMDNPHVYAIADAALREMKRGKAYRNSFQYHWKNMWCHDSNIVVQSAVGERSYHIFYQLCAGAPASLKEKLNLKKVDEYKYLKQSCCYSIAGVDDAQMFRTVTEAMNIVHISKEDQENVFAMVSAVLWLGDVSFTVIDNENHVEIVVDEASKTVAELLGCSIEDLNLALSKRHMKVNNENIVQKLTLTQEYVEDGIDWAKVEFEDNQHCLNLFEKVAYDTSGFLEKNRDLLHMDSIQLLAKCKSSLPKMFASKMLAQSDNSISVPYRSNAADSQKLSVAMKFKGQLFQLMQRLESTTPHFIRCIKPNNLQLPAIYEQGLVLQQLKCCGVLEVVRISRSGYPTRMTHQKFARRYGFLLLEDVASQDPLSVSVAILHQFNILPEMYQVGYTKLFFRTGQIGKLEDTRNRTLHGIRGSLVRRCNGNIDLINVLREFESKQEAEGDQILIKASVLAELQRRILKAEATIREKDEENEMLHQRLQQYENRWLEYEQKMKAMEEMWQKQMRSLQSSLSVAKKSLALDETPRMSDSSVDQSWEINGNHVGSGSQLVPRTAGREMNAGLSVINRLTEEFEQRSQVFADDATFIVEVKSGQADASLNPDMELRRLKQNFDSWKKDFGGRIRETKVILNKLGNGNESSPNSVKRKWWGRLNTSKFS